MQMKKIAQSKNVFCKVSGLATEADWKHSKADDFKPYLDVIFDAFDVERLMFGSDWPVCLLAGTYRQFKKLVEDYVKEYPPAFQEKIFGGNAVRFYGLETVQHGSAT